MEPGDILLTGTPAGVGLATGTFLKVGDVVEAEIDGLGRLSFIDEVRPGLQSPLGRAS